MPEELWMEVCDIVQEAVIRTIPKKKKCKKAKSLSEEALQIPDKRKEAKSKGEKQRYSHLNAELQGIARRNKKAFLSDQSKEIEENNRMGKTRDLFKKIRDTKGTFHAKMDTIKDRNSMQKQTVLRKCDKNMQINYIKKALNYPDNHYGVVTHLEPDILECEVKCALGSITMNKDGGWRSQGSITVNKDGRVPRWQRNRMGRTLSPPRIH